MSLDLFLYKHASRCRECGSIVGEGELIWERNITHNVSPMWRKAGIYEVMYQSTGQMAMKYIPILQNGLTRMIEDFSEYKSLEFASGWGKAEHALAFLWAAYRAFRDNPGAIIRVSQ